MLSGLENVGAIEHTFVSCFSRGSGLSLLHSPDLRFRVSDYRSERESTNIH